MKTAETDIEIGAWDILSTLILLVFLYASLMPQ